jgi:hypothetical protein
MGIAATLAASVGYGLSASRALQAAEDPDALGSLPPLKSAMHNSVVPNECLKRHLN